VQPTTASHAGGIDSVEKPGWIGCKPNFPCNICKGDHLNHPFLGIPEVQILWPLSATSSDSESYEVSSKYIQPLVDEMVVPMQSLTDPTPIFGGDVSVDHVVSQPIQPVVEKVVTPTQSSADPSLLLESVESTKAVTSMQSSTDPTLLVESDVSIDYVFSISSLVLL
jgi:hypothetical protein